MGISKIDRYLFWEWLKVFLLTLGVVLGLLILEDMYDDLPDLLDYGAGPSDIGLYYLVLLPSFLPLVLPISLLVSLLFSLGSLHKNNEIVALRAAGLSLWRISRGLWFAGLLLTALLFALNSRWVPWSVETSRELLDGLRFTSQEAGGVDFREIGQVPNLSFDNRRAGRLWFMNGFSERAFLGVGVTVYTRDRDGRERYRIAAREAVFEESEGYWRFLDGREITYNAEGEPIRSVGFDEKKMLEYREHPELMLALNKRPKDLSFFEIRGILSSIQPEENPRVYAYLVQYYQILAAPFSCLVVMGLAIPFAVSGVRTNPLVGVSKSVGFFILFYFMSNICIVLGERQLIPAEVAAWAPNGLMFFIGALLFHRAR